VKCRGDGAAQFLFGLLGVSQTGAHPVTDMQRQRHRLFVYEAYLRILKEGTEPLP
jgi:hypothetical protein